MYDDFNLLWTSVCLHCSHNSRTQKSSSETCREYLSRCKQSIVEESSFEIHNLLLHSADLFLSGKSSKRLNARPQYSTAVQSGPSIRSRRTRSLPMNPVRPLSYLMLSLVGPRNYQMAARPTSGSSRAPGFCGRSLSRRFLSSGYVMRQIRNQGTEFEFISSQL